MDIVKESQDFTYLNWERVRHSFGTAGSLLKSEEIIDGQKFYYKLSSYSPIHGIVGHECINELIVSRLLSALNIPHLKYQLINASIVIDDKEHTSFICKSADFKKAGEKKIAFDDYYMVYRQDSESPLDFCIRNSFDNYVYTMFSVDYLIRNMDRHGANVEVLKNPAGEIRLAPLFDHGASLLYDKNHPELLSKTDLLFNGKSNDFIGTGNCLENLNLVPKDKLLALDGDATKIINNIFFDLDDVLPHIYIEKISEMLIERWRFYEIFRNSQ